MNFPPRSTGDHDVLLDTAAARFARMAFGANIIETGSDSYRLARSHNDQHPVTVGRSNR